MMNRVMKHALNGLSALRLNRVGDLHAPSRAQLGNLKDDGSSIFRQLGTGDSGRPLVIMVGAIIDCSFQRPGLGSVIGGFTGIFPVETSGKGDRQAISPCAQADRYEQRLAGCANSIEASRLCPITGPAE